MKTSITVIIPEFEYKYLVAKKTKKSGKPRYWTVNGQGLYNATLHFRARGTMTKYFHNYLSKYIKEQITPNALSYIRMVDPSSRMKMAISLDIYEIRRNKMPDIGNMWIWLKWFEDALQECGIIPDDNPDYVIESGRTRYHWIDDAKDRKLVFHINFLNV